MRVQDRIIGQRLVSSEGMSDNILPLSVNQIKFNFTLESRQPFNVTLSVFNVSVDMNIQCQEYLATTTNVLTTALHIIQVSLNDIQSKSFNFTQLVLIIIFNLVIPDDQPLAIKTAITW